MIFLKINCPNFSSHTKFQIGMAAAIPAIPLQVPLIVLSKAIIVDYRGKVLKIKYLGLRCLTSYTWGSKRNARSAAKLWTVHIYKRTIVHQAPPKLYLSCRFQS